jgi:hypothetical protein
MGQCDRGEPMTCVDEIESDTIDECLRCIHIKS